MIKKVINLVIFVFLAVLIVWVLTKIRGTEEVAGDYNFIPHDAALVLRLNSIETFKEDLLKSNVWKQLSGIEPFRDLESHILKIDSVFKSNRSTLDSYRNINLYLSLHLIGKNKPDFMYRLVFPKSFNVKNISQQINHLYGSSKKSTRKYEGHEIVDISPESHENFSYTFLKNQLLISSSAIVLENIIRQGEQPGTSANRASIIRLLNTAGKTVSANLIINHTELAKFFQSKSRSRSSFPLGFFKSFSDWSVLDLNLSGNSILASGFSNSSDSLVNYLSILKGQEPSEIMFTSVAPANTKLFLSLNISNPELFVKNYKKFLKQESINPDFIGYSEKLKSGYDIDVNEFYEFIEKEITYIRTDYKLNAYEDNVFALVRVKSQNIARNFFREGLKKYAKEKGLNSNNFIQTFHVDNSTKFEIIKFPIENFLSGTLGSLFSEIDVPHIALIDGYAVFASSRDALEKLIHFKILGKTLQNDFTFGKMEQYYSSASNIHYYQNIPNSLDVISRNTNDELVSSIRDNEEMFMKIPTFGFQFNSTSDFTFSSIFLNYFDWIEADAHTLWETLLDTSIRFKPTLVENHYTGENEIFIQDLKNNIYLINKVGRVLWKVKLNEQIMGDINQVDYYKNGKLQFLFSTKSQIHLIDRNGNYVERYPVNLRAEASAPLSLFDYENNKDYRIFVPAADKKIYAYTIEGNIIEGWQFKGAERVVKDPVQHFRVEDKDYIVFSDGLRTYILNRRGESRVPTNVIFQKSGYNNFIFEEKTALNNARIAVTDTSGQIWFFNFEGVHETKAFRKLSANHFFDFQDINADGYRDYIFLDEDKLYVYDQRTDKEIFSYKFKNTIQFRPIYFQFSFSDRKLGITDFEENKVYLINSDGNLYKGFPLQGNSLYSIGRLTSSNRFNLIVGNNNNFLLNYSVQ